MSRRYLILPLLLAGLVALPACQSDENTFQRTFSKAQAAGPQGDTHEPNEALHEAKSFSLDTSVDASIHATTDIDIFSITLTHHIRYQLELSQDNAAATLAVNISDTGTETFAWSITGASSTNTFDVKVNKGGLYYLTVAVSSGWDPGSNNNYNFKLKVIGDDKEPNDTLIQPTNFALSTDYYANLFNQSDIDIYKVTLTEYVTYEFTATNFPTGVPSGTTRVEISDNLPVIGADAFWEFVIWNTGSVSKNEYTIPAISGAGVTSISYYYTLRTVDASFSTELYTFRVDAISDNLEPNNEDGGITIGPDDQSTAIGIGSTIGANLYDENDVDIYKVVLANNTSYTYTLTNVPAGDTAVRIYDTATPDFGSAGWDHNNLTNINTNNNNFTTGAAEGGAYYIKIYTLAAGKDRNNYTFVLDSP